MGDKRVKNKNIGKTARVDGNAKMFQDASVFGNARVSGYAQLFGYSSISGNAWVFDEAEISDCASVLGNARVYGKACLTGDAQVCDDAWVFGNTVIIGGVIDGKARIGSSADVLQVNMGEICWSRFVTADGYRTTPDNEPPPVIKALFDLWENNHG
jgi:UDP-3-O-[3-hydroxymyristoyl] glucosamine N-acyltransferase